MNWEPSPGDLCQYMSRTLLVIGNPYAANADWNEPHADWSELWIDTIEIDNNTPRKVRCDALTLIQRAKGNKND